MSPGMYSIIHLLEIMHLSAFKSLYSIHPLRCIPFHHQQNGCSGRIHFHSQQNGLAGCIPFQIQQHGREGCITFNCQQYGRAGYIHLHSQQNGLAGCIPFHRQQYGRAGCIPFHHQYGRAVCIIFYHQQCECAGCFPVLWLQCGTCRVYVSLFLTRFRRASTGEVIHGWKRGFSLVLATVVIFSADLKSFLTHLSNVHFPITRSVLTFLKKKVIFSC